MTSTSALKILKHRHLTALRLQYAPKNGLTVLRLPEKLQSLKACQILTPETMPSRISNQVPIHSLADST